MEKREEEILFGIAKENTYIKQLGIRLLELREGYARGCLYITDAVKNPYGSVHGGCLYSMADCIAGFAACTYGQFCSTVSGTMNFLKPAMNVEEIFCEAYQVRQGKNLSVYNVELKSKEGVLFEIGTFTFYMLDRYVTDEPSC